MVCTIKCMICGRLSTHLEECLLVNKAFPCPGCMKLDEGTKYPVGYWELIGKYELRKSDEFFKCCRRSKNERPESTAMD